MLLHRFCKRLRACAWLALLGLCVPGVSAATIGAGDASLAGWVYIDRNNDGQLAFAEDPNPEFAIPEVEISLYELTDSGEVLLATDLSNFEGRYEFEGLAAGAYTLRQTQPVEYVDGKDTPGLITANDGDTLPDIVSPGYPTENAIEEIVITNNSSGDHFYFGELGMAPEYVTKRYLLGTTIPMIVPEGKPEGIPEPATTLLLAMAVGAANLRRQRKR